MADFIEIADSIFVNKHKYQNITDEDKEKQFYILNKKFSIAFPKTAQAFNMKGVDRASIMDLWFIKFKNDHKLPYWYWAKSPFSRDKNNYSAPDRKLLMEEFDLTNNEFEFLVDNFKEDSDYELKMIKRWLKK